LSPRSRIRNAALFFSTFLFLAVGFPLVAYAWWRSSGSWPFVAFVMGVPVLFGYLMPAVATQFVKRWQFTSGPRIGSYYVHHGFVYGSKLAFVLLVVIRSLAGVRSALDVAAIVAVTGAATAFGGWWHDLNAIREGRITIDGGADALASFAPATYFSMGATYAAVALAAHRLLVVEGGSLVWIFPAGLVILCLIPTAVFLAVDPPTREFLRRSLAGSRSF